MLYLAIDQHAKQLTVNLRNESGAVMRRCQVSTQPEKVRAFFQGLQQQAAPEGGYFAILEVCGFNDWLLKLLPEYGCRETVLVQAPQPSKQKTDRRDANKLGELLWINRHRLLAGQRLVEIRRVQPATPVDAAARQITALRQQLGAERTRVINRAGAILKKHNLQHACPTKGLATKGARHWLMTLPLPEIDRLEMDLILTHWKLLDEHLEKINAQIKERRANHRLAAIISTVPGLQGYGGLAIASRIGDIQRFRTPGSLANYFGLTPGCRNSGESQQRLGSITKQGSPLVRFLLGQAVLHALKSDRALREWYKAVKSRRGSKIARVAVMRRLATTIWHLAKHEQPYRAGGRPRGPAQSPPAPSLAGVPRKDRREEITPNP
jgi:transposase